jgi:hypothetical protein
MKLMKCPHCEEISTFTQQWSATTEFWAPLIIDDDGKIHVDYDEAEDSSSDVDGPSTDKCVCDNCNKELSIDNIKIVENENVVLAE